jgi:ribulose-bisphosphate carboxylase large chain
VRFRSIKFFLEAFTENDKSDTIANRDFACNLNRPIQSFLKEVALNLQVNMSLRDRVMPTQPSSPEWIEADYSLETTSEVEKTAAIMAGEQSSGTFLAIPGETESLKQKFSAIVSSITRSDDHPTQPSLPSTGWKGDGSERINRALITLRWPAANIGPSLPNLMATIAGNLFELRPVTGLRLLDIRLPQSFADRYRGPRFGIEGTRAFTQVKNRPLIGTIIKPSIGLTANETVSKVQALCEAGIDFIKDDELQTDGIGCPFEDRVTAVMRVINNHAERTGRKVMFAFNLTGEIDQMRRRHDVLLKHQATCLMASLNSVGLTGFIELARFSQLPIHAHRNGWGYLSRHPYLGWSYTAWHKIWRLAGADHMHVNGLSNKFSEPDDRVIQSAKSCLTPLFPNTPCLSMPVFSSGQTARVVEATYHALNSPDLIFAAGGGILGHPNGLSAGVRSIKLAWELALSGHSVQVAAQHDKDLKIALDMMA